MEEDDDDDDDINKLEFSEQIFEKYSNFQFHENPFSGSQGPCLRMDGQTDRQVDRQAWRS